MEHWFIFIRGIGDVLYLIAAVLTLVAVRTEPACRHGNDTSTEE
jgi:hypothetical protein